MGANSFLYETTPISIGGNKENDRVASPESVSIHLKLGTSLCFSGILSKADIFHDSLFALLGIERGLFLKEKLCSYGSKFFPQLKKVKPSGRAREYLGHSI